MNFAVNVKIELQIEISQELQMLEVMPQRSHTVGTNPVPAKMKNLQRGESGKGERECCGAIGPYVAALKIEVLKRGKAGQVWPQCRGALRTYFVALKRQKREG